MILLCLLLGLHQQEPPPDVPQGETPAVDFTWLTPLHGSILAKFRNRWTSDDSDADLFEYVTAEYGDPRKDAITLSASARFAEDLDGERDVGGFFAFDSLDDTYRRSSTARLYTAYADFHRPLPGLKLRAGRQILDDVPEAVPMDGGRVGYQLSEKVKLNAFGGLPANPYESSFEGDVMYGGSAEYVPWARGRARLEYLHLEDENVFGLFKDDLLGLVLEQAAGSLSAYARYTVLESESRDVTARLTASVESAELILDTQFSYLFETQRALAYALDPYSILLVELQPYAQASVRASKRLGANVTLDGSITARELVEDDDDTEFNHEFVRANLTPRLADWPLRDVSFDMGVDYWRSSADDFWTLGGDVSWRAHDDITLGAGTAFSLYVIDTFTGEERQRVRSIYGTVRWKVQKAMSMDLRGSVDKDEFDTYTTVEVGVRRAF